MNIRPLALLVGFVVSAPVLVSSADAYAQTSDVYLYGQKPGSWAQRRPRLTLGGELGISHFVEGGPFGFDSGTGSVTETGPAWGLRVGVDLLSWLGFEGRYVGAWHSGDSRASGMGFAMVGGEAIVRFGLPLPWVRPYLFAGIGVYDWEAIGSQSALAASQLHSSSQPGVPMGIGVETMLSRHWTIALEGTFRFLIGESFSSTNEDIAGADQTTLTGVLRFRL